MTDLLEEAISNYFGERCPEFEPGCPCCRALAEFDEIERLRAALRYFEFDEAGARAFIQGGS